MFANFEEKGKIYTQVVTKEPVDVIIQTTSHQIHGKIHIKPGDRLKDELDSCEHFLAVTDAIVLNYYGKGTPLPTSFMAVNMGAVVWVIPDDKLLHETESSE